MAPQLCSWQVSHFRIPIHPNHPNKPHGLASFYGLRMLAAIWSFCTCASRPPAPRAKHARDCTWASASFSSSAAAWSPSWPRPPKHRAASALHLTAVAVVAAVCSILSPKQVLSSKTCIQYGIALKYGLKWQSQQVPTLNPLQIQWARDRSHSAISAVLNDAANWSWATHAEITSPKQITLSKTIVPKTVGKLFWFYINQRRVSHFIWKNTGHEMGNWSKQLNLWLPIGWSKARSSPKSILRSQALGTARGAWPWGNKSKAFSKNETTHSQLFSNQSIIQCLKLTSNIYLYITYYNQKNWTT